MEFFKNVAGTVLAFKDSQGDSPQAGVVRVEGQGDISLEAGDDIIINSFQMKNSVAYRSTPTIGGPNYLFAFGDNTANITLNITMFEGSSCIGNDSSRRAQGIANSLQFYANNRVTPVDAPIVQIAYGANGGAVINGFLVGFTPTSQSGNGVLYHSGILNLIGWVNDPSFTGKNRQSLGGGGSIGGGGDVEGDGTQTWLIDENGIGYWSDSGPRPGRDSGNSVSGEPPQYVASR